jgi:type III restriction enzyme
MTDVLIENPILNSPYREPSRHFLFGEAGITGEIIEERRQSSYFVPVPAPKKRAQLPLDTEWTADRIRENEFINRMRERVALFRRGEYVGVTPITRRLLDYWTDPKREKPLFFCQVEALETAIYLTEAASRSGDVWIENAVREANEAHNPGLYRIALKMATGTGKTVVMAMLIAWQTLNKLANPQDRRFTDAFLVVAPGITIRDRLRVLLPSDPGNYYRERDIVPPELAAQLQQARIVVTNFHAFLFRDRGNASSLTKKILARGGSNPFLETPDEMVRRVCRELGTKRQIVVINDEAHHCYRHKPDSPDERLSRDERQEAKQREEEARVWISGLAAVERKIGIKTIYDLSATPFFLRGSGYPEGTLFPWVVSDFALIDAIESGLVKVPRVPIADDSMTGELPTYRNLWIRIRDRLPKKGRKTAAVTGEPKLPAELEAALQSLYGNYERNFERWRADEGARRGGATPPVFIVVCNNTNVSKLVHDWIAGWEKTLRDGSKVLVPGNLALFSNVADGHWLDRPYTILIDSRELESGGSLSAGFKKLMTREIDEWKDEYRRRFPGRDPEQLDAANLLREVMNTVGKPGKLGERIRCVVSVSMLTEGWDANTVTHILGVRAFGTQLLCEQVVGRGLRRRSYALNDKGRFEPEYAEVYGVPFSFIPCSGSSVTPPPPVHVTRVRALEDRLDREIRFPLLEGYRYELSAERLEARFSEDSIRALSTADIPTKTENAPIVGERTILTLDELKKRRHAEVVFLLAKLVLEKYFPRDGRARETAESMHRFDAEVQSWLFPQVLEITRRWLVECVRLKDNTFPQMLLLLELAHDAADRIYRSIVRAADGEKRLVPILRPYDTVGSTRYVDFDTARDVYETDPPKCHVSHVALDSGWEAKLAQGLEEMEEVLSYVKNQQLGFTIPYTFDGEHRQYLPDYIILLDDGHDTEGPLHLILEVTGEAKRDKQAKTATARDLWVPAVNNHGGFGRWMFLEVTDPWDAKNAIRGLVAARTTPAPL